MKKKILKLQTMVAFKAMLVLLLFFVMVPGSLFAQGPYNIPGRVEAESYFAKNGPQYAIASTDAGGGQQVIGITNGSWMDYTINAITSGMYSVGFRVATMQNSIQFQVKSMPSGTVLGTKAIANTSGWSNWQTQSVDLTLPLSAGLQTIRIQAISSNNEGCNFNWMDWNTACTIPDVNQPANQTVCKNTATAAINFSGSVAGTQFKWTNNNPSIGLAASGTGNIPSFTATNTTNAPITATVTVTPAYSSGFAYIPNEGSNNVSVINLTTNTVVSTVPVGAGPACVSVSPDGSRVYIGNDNSSGTVSVINTATNTVVATIPVGSYPDGVSVSPDGSKVYVSNAGSGTVSVINTATNLVVATVPVGENPVGVSVSPDGSKLYVSIWYSNIVSVINTASYTVVATIPVGVSPSYMSVNPDGSKVYVANTRSNNVSVINTTTNSVVATIPVGSGPRGISVTPDGSKVYVANWDSGNVSVINTATNTVVATVPAGSGPGGVSVSPDGSRVYVTNHSSNNVSVINTATNMVAATVPVGSGPVAFGNFISGNACTGISKTFTITVDPACGKAIPGRVEAENFDVKSPPPYIIVPTNDPLGGGGHVGGFINGTFMDYYVNVATTGNYRVAFRIATTQNGDRIQVKSMPTGTVLGTVTIPNTGSWSNWVTTELSAPIALTAGSQTIRLQFVSDNPEGANINWMDWDFTSEVTICNQTWMTKNLDVTTYRNGDPIPQVTDPTAWIGLTTGAWCYYNNDPAMGAAYGKLYNWYAVNDPRGLAPVGWHVPSDAELTALFSCLGGENIAGGAMKSTSGWYENGNGTNSSGFSGFPGGLRANYSPAGFLNRSFGGYWWNSTAGYFVMFYNVSYITRGVSPGVGNGFSVRCIRDITDGGSCIDVQAENFIAKAGGAFAQPGNDATDPLPSSPVMVGFTNGNWMDYNVTIPTSGTYAVSFRYATTQNSVKFQLYSGGVPVGGLISAPNTGGWSAFATTAPVTISVTAGLQVIRVQVVANGSEGCNFNWFRFCAAGVPPVATVSKAPVLTDIVTSKLAVSVYPNPSDANFSLRVQGKNMNPISIRVLDMTARLVQKLQSIPGQVISFGENLKSGIYFVEVQQGAEKSVTKVVKN